jgi:hypothetical protein
MSAQSRAIAAGLAAGLRYRGQSVTYRRLTATKTIKVMRGRTLQDQMSTAAVYSSASAELTDWVFPATALAGWTPATPAAGDLVVSGSTTYLVSAAEDGRPWRYADPDETYIRVHSVRT